MNDDATTTTLARPRSPDKGAASRPRGVAAIIAKIHRSLRARFGDVQVAANVAGDLPYAFTINRCGSAPSYRAQQTQVPLSAAFLRNLARARAAEMGTDRNARVRNARLIADELLRAQANSGAGHVIRGGVSSAPPIEIVQHDVPVQGLRRRHAVAAPMRRIRSATGRGGRRRRTPRRSRVTRAGPSEPAPEPPAAQSARHDDWGRS